MSAVRDSDAVAEALGEHPPQLDDLAKARIEKRLLEAARAPRTAAAPATSRRATGWLVAGGAVAVAAAVGLGIFAWRGDAPATRVARMELRSVGATQQRGTIEEGSSLRTGPGEVAEIRVEDSVIHLEPSTELRLDAVRGDRVELALAHGEVRVEFHPRAPGREGMSVRTERATVEVVGTVFTVRESASATEVVVSEGRVRVVPREGEARFVAAGEGTRVEAEQRVEAVAPALDVAAADVPAAEPASPPQTERERRALSPAQRLARARALIAQGENDAAVELLRGVAGASDASAAIRAQASTLLGDVLQRQGALPEAAEAYEGAARQGAGQYSALAIWALARMQERRLDDRDAAIASYRRYLDQSGNGPLAGQARQALCRLGDASACPAEPAP